VRVCCRERVPKQGAAGAAACHVGRLPQVRCRQCFKYCCFGVLSVAWYCQKEVQAPAGCGRSSCMPCGTFASGEVWRTAGVSLVAFYMLWQRQCTRAGCSRSSCMPCGTLASGERERVKCRVLLFVSFGGVLRAVASACPSRVRQQQLHAIRDVCRGRDAAITACWCVVCSFYRHECEPA
jgi:hypothetical protein